MEAFFGGAFEMEAFSLGCFPNGGDLKKSEGLPKKFHKNRGKGI